MTRSERSRAPATRGKGRKREVISATASFLFLA
jgi:hypothetical protein